MVIEQIGSTIYRITLDGFELAVIDEYVKTNGVDPVRVLERIMSDGFKFFNTFDIRIDE